MVYYDTLSPFVRKESYNYIQHKNFKLSMIPQLRLNIWKIYEHCIIGMCQEVMSLDAHLRYDLHEVDKMHVNLTSYLPYS